MKIFMLIINRSKNIAIGTLLSQPPLSEMYLAYLNINIIRKMVFFTCFFLYLMLHGALHVTKVNSLNPHDLYIHTLYFCVYIIKPTPSMV